MVVTVVESLLKSGTGSSHNFNEAVAVLITVNVLLPDSRKIARTRTRVPPIWTVNGVNGSPQKQRKPEHKLRVVGSRERETLRFGASWTDPVLRDESDRTQQAFDRQVFPQQAIGRDTCLRS